MRKINKGEPPISFRDWVRKKPKSKDENQWFQELYIQKHWDIVNALSLHNTKEQFYICAYCCDRIEGTKADTKNEHVEARAIAPHRSLDHTNIVASCNNKGRCDNAHAGQPLPLTPLMEECENELKFKISGRVEGLTPRAIEAIRVLNLGDIEQNNKALVEKRKRLSSDLLWINGVNPEEGLEDDELLRSVITDLLTPKDSKLVPFAPVVVNIIRNWIK
ncbi:hypothetical protein [Chrysiogenes arsenatis]|uniref:hypothetical protein n=1 Tax=Chrysiogenes arsenatis TaxID=309797 RepID=UPI00040FF9BB|nr:hypothetical protein [Chrysiogenes arsenatis]